MKQKIFNSFLLLGLLVSLMGCSSLGVSTTGANYFVGKKEADLVKYFKYNGEVLESSSTEYDKVMYFTNLIRTVYVDKTTVVKFKNRKYNTVSNFNFYELYDGCYIYPGTVHHESVHKTQYIDGTVLTKDDDTHRNNNDEINSKIKSFNSLAQQYGAVKKSNDNAMFERTNIGDSYYIYDIQ